MRIALVLAALIGAGPAMAAEPIKLGITTILSGPIADRGQSEQYGAQLALDQINESGGVLGRPLEAFYADNACKPDIGVPATKHLLDEVKVPVVIGALCTPVTHAIMPVMAEAKVPLVIATSAGQDFVDASGVGGNAYAFKTIASDLDIARGLVKWGEANKVHRIVLLADADGFQQSNGRTLAKAATDAGMVITANQTLGKDTDLPALLKTLQDGHPDAIMLNLAGSNAAFFKAFEASGWKIPLSGRIDLAGAQAAVSPAFRDAGGLAAVSSIAVFSPALPIPAVQDFVASYRAHTGLTPTQRPFFVYEAVFLIADAIRRAGTDTPAAIETALKSTTMPSLLGGTYTMDEHNHPHLPLFILGLRGGKPAVIATE
jgi:branched-chain amino acid transport system substrate-binding protein